MKKVLMAVVLLGYGCGNTVDVTAPSVSMQLGDTQQTPGGSVARPEVWYVPAPHSRDFLDLFRYPEQWPNARARITTFGFFQGQTFPGATHPEHSPNFYESFVGVNAFSLLTTWGKDINFEAGAVKEYSCTNDGETAWTDVWGTKSSIYGVNQAGGRVRYISMDEPFTAALRGGINMQDGSQIRACPEYTLERTAKQIRWYTEAIHHDVRTLPDGAIGRYDPWIGEAPAMVTAFPEVHVGLIEAYPEFSISEFKQMVLALEAEGVHLPHLHIDIDMYRAVREQQNLSKDLGDLAAFLKQRKITFGIIIWGERGLSDQTYYDDAIKFALRIRQALPRGAPDRLIFESWARYLPARPIDDVRTPQNIPEYDDTPNDQNHPLTHTRIVNEGSALFDQ